MAFSPISVQKTKEVRNKLNDAMVNVLDQMLSKDPTAAKSTPTTARTDPIVDEIQQLSPKNDQQRYLQNRAFNVKVNIAQTCWSMFEQAAKWSFHAVDHGVAFFGSLFLLASICLPLPMRASWPALLYPLWPFHSAIAIIFDMYTPYKGLMRISGASPRLLLRSSVSNTRASLFGVGISRG